MLLAAGAILAQFHAPRIVTAILLSSVVAFFAITTLKGDHGTNVFLLGSHLTTLLSNY
jgi:hypothetical protein